MPYGRRIDGGNGSASQETHEPSITVRQPTPEPLGLRHCVTKFHIINVPAKQYQTENKEVNCKKKGDTKNLCKGSSRTPKPPESKEKAHCMESSGMAPSTLGWVQSGWDALVLHAHEAALCGALLPILGQTLLNVKHLPGIATRPQSDDYG